jgi:hypothetical protein
MVTAPQIPPQPQAAATSVNQGGTVNPVYGTRQPMMYHLFENEVKSISSLNAVALSMFSVGSFFANSIIAIAIGWGFSAPPLSEFGSFMCHRGAYFIGVLMLLCFGGGIWAVGQKKSIIDQIKSETKTDGPRV